VTDSEPRPRASEPPLSEVQLNARRRAAGAEGLARHCIYLGMAPGVGKTYAALHELRRRKAEGIDAVIAFVETYNRARTIEAIGDLQIVPRKKIAYQGRELEEMDLDAVLARRPDVVLVDELAHTNAPGSRHEKRWQDVRELLDADISVVSTLNIQHLESLADIVAAITGVTIRERIPDRVVDEADEIELVDLSPRALRMRIERGEVYPRVRAEQALRQYFREGNLTALRELALRKVSTEVERDLESFMRENGVQATWPAGERVMVGVDEWPAAQLTLRRGWRMANRSNADLLAVFVETDDWAAASGDRRRALEDNLRFAEDLGARLIRVHDSDIASALVRVAREQNVANLVVGHSRHGGLRELLGPSVASKLLRLAEDVDIHVVALRDRS
jgi:two-component system sensor histidine kinase KdpD